MLGNGFTHLVVVPVLFRYCVITVGVDAVLSKIADGVGHEKRKRRVVYDAWSYPWPPGSRMRPRKNISVLVVLQERDVGEKRLHWRLRTIVSSYSRWSMIQ